ncbi:MAG: hypothetical protein WKF94_16115 [Solirubrobacteraceae bacterium]
MLADLLGSVAEFFIGLVPDRQPWRGLMLAFFLLAVASAVVGLFIAAEIV